MTIDWLKDKTTGQKFYPVTHEDAVIDSNGITLSTKLNLKQDKLRVTIGSMYRTNVGGSGSLSISGTTGLFPNISTAGTYTVITLAESTTSNYTINITFGSNSYTLTSNNGIIDDSRLLTLATNDRWKGVISTVATNTKVGVYIVDDYIEGINIVGVTGNYSDLSNKPDLSLKENISNKVTSISSSSTNTLYPSALAVYNALQAIDTGSDSGSCPDLSLGTTSGAGNAVTDISVSGHLITMTKGSTFLTSGTTLDSITDGSTRKLANYLPLSGGTMTGAIILPTSTSATDTTKGINFANGNSIIGHVGSSTLLGIYSTGKIVLRPNNALAGATGNGSLEIDTAGITAYEKITAEGFIKSGGTSSQFLKADGSVDSNTYLTSETSLSKGTTTGTGNAVTDITVSGHTITLNKGTSFATLDSNGLVSANQLPSYVDDIIDGYKYGSDFYRPLVDGELKIDATSSDFTNDTKVTPVKNKIYFWVGDGHCYRWSGTEYVLIVASPGTTSNVPEGSNLYFTDARALAAVATLLSGKADKAIPTAANNVALLDASGNLVDSGKTLGKSVPSNAVFTDVACNEQYHYTPSTADNSSNISLVPDGVLKIITAINLDSRKHVVSVTSGDLTKNMVGLSSVTNDRQVKGLSSGTTSGHIVTFGSDGYTITDSGVSVSDLSGGGSGDGEDLGPLFITSYITDTSVGSGTYALITLAIIDGRDVILKVINDNADDEIRYYRLLIDYSENDDLYTFSCVIGAYFYLGTISSSNSLSFTSISLGGGSGLPSVTSSDNNKILLVVNGSWTLVTPPAIYSGSTTPSSSLGNNGDIYIQTS